MRAKDVLKATLLALAQREADIAVELDLQGIGPVQSPWCEKCLDLGISHWRWTPCEDGGTQLRIF